MSFCTHSLHFVFLQREKRLGRIEEQNFEDRRPLSRVSSLKRKPSDLKPQRGLSSRDIVRRASSGRREWTTKSPAVNKKDTATLSSSFSSSRKSESDEDSSSSTSPPSSPTMRSNTRRIIQEDLIQSASFKSKSPLTSPPASPQPLLSPSREILKEDLGSWSSPTVKPWTRRSFQSNETSDFLLDLSTFEENEQRYPPSSLEPPSLSRTNILSKEIPEVDLHSWSSSTVKPLSKITFQSDEKSRSLVEFSVKSASEENLQTSLPSSLKPPLPPKPTVPSKEIPHEDPDPSFSPAVKPWVRRTFLSDETPSSPLELSIKSTHKETHQTSPPSSPEPFSSPKTTSLSKEIPQEDLLTGSRPIVKPRSRRSFQSDETLSSPLELPVKSTFEEPHQTSPPHSPKTPSSPKSLLLSEWADEVDGRPRSKPPLAPKPKSVSSEVTSSHQPKKTPAPRLSPPVTRRFPAPTEPPPPPPEKHSPPSNSPPTAELISITEDDSASEHPATATHALHPSSLQLGFLDVLQKEDGSGLFSSKQEVETKLQNQSNMFL